MSSGMSAASVISQSVLARTDEIVTSYYRRAGSREPGGPRRRI